MQPNQLMEGAKNGGESSSSDYRQIVAALRETMKPEIEAMVIHTVQQVIGPIVEDLIRKVVKEEIQSAQEKLLTGGNRNHDDEIIMSKERSLQLKFSDEVSVPVLTGKEIKGRGDTPIRVELVDKNTGQVVDCGPESSAKVEILVLDASRDDDEHNWNLENFNSRIIREGDKEKPHFAKSNYIHLNEGTCVLQNSKLGHDSNWMKSSKCRLGARIVQSFSGIKVQEAWTKSFMVLDSRSKLYGKHYPPSLSDPVWRLENISKDGPPCKRLKEKGICTVKDFLFLHSINPQKLLQIVAAGAKKTTIAAGAKWKATVDHAQTCNIDDKRMYLYYPSSEFEMGVVFDVVGGLKGVILDAHYVLINNLSEAEKACACKLLLSASETQKDITYFQDETSLVHQFPYISSDVNAATNTSTREGTRGSDLTVPENINGDDPTEPGTSSRRINQTIGPFGQSTNRCHLGSLGWTTTGNLYEPYLGNTNQDPIFDFDLDSILKHVDDYDYESHFGDYDYESLNSALPPECNNIPETLRVESHSHQQSNDGSIHLVGAVTVILRMLRLRKMLMLRVRKRFMAFGDNNVQKRQRICEQDE